MELHRVKIGELLYLTPETTELFAYLCTCVGRKSTYTP